MREMKHFFCLLGVIIFAGTTYASKEIFEGRIKALQEAFPGSHIGVAILPVQETPNTSSTEGPSCPLYVNYQANKLFVPASTLKTVSSYFALKILGADYRYQTQAFVDKEILYLKFSGDPSFRLKHLEKFLAAYHQKHKKYPTEIVLDTTAFPFPAQAPTWMLEDQMFCYGAPLNGANLNQNRVNFTLNPGDRLGAVTIVSPSNPTKFRIRNQAKACACDGLHKKKAYACGLERRDFVHGTTLYGCHDKSLYDLRLCFPLLSRLDVFKNAVTTLLEQKGQTAKRLSVKDGVVPQTAKALSVHASPPIERFLQQILQESDNLYTESLFLSASRQLNPHVYKWEQAAEVMQGEMTRRYPHWFEGSPVKLADGSGLSRAQYVSPNFMVRVLQTIIEDKAMWPMFKAYLATPENKKVFLKEYKPLQGRLWVKTGSHSGILSLVGFYKAPSGSMYAFCFVVNNFYDHVSEKRKVFDRAVLKILTALR